jgi:uncharacterized membrane protein YjjP (DUF1212 family)
MEDQSRLPLLSRLEHKEILAITIRAASMILENGGETYRAEETAVKTALSFGAVTATAFVTPTVVQVSYTDEDKRYHTAVQRLTKRGVNLKKISQVNELSRRLAKRETITKPGQVERILNRIDNTPQYQVWMIVGGASLSSFFFALMFGGILVEAVTALCIGFILRISLLILDKAHLNSFIISLLSGAVVSICTEAAYIFTLIPSIEIVMTSVLMQVVPGLAIVNAIRDMIAGDLVAGNARLIEAFMIAAGLSVGAVTGMLLFGGLL